MTDTNSRKHALRAVMVSLGFARDRSETNAYRYCGVVNVAGRNVSLALTFDDLEFVRLPTATLLDPEKEAPDVVAHLSATGVLCFANNADIVLDRYDPAGTVQMCFELAKRGLERALTRKYVQAEIAAEFPQHWQGDTFYYDLKPGSRAKLVTLNRPFGACTLLLSDEQLARRFAMNGPATEKAIKVAQAVHVVHSMVPLTFNEKEAPPTNLGDFLDWLESHLPGKKESVLDAIASGYPETRPVFVVASNGCIGIDVPLAVNVRKNLQRAQGLRRLLAQGRLPVRRYAGSRADETFIFGRNMATETPLLAKRIALIGCGTIGSYLAKLLMHAGAGFGGGRLLMLDKEVLQPGNIGRHFLGSTRLGEFKAPALKDELDKMLPGANSVALTGDAINIFNSLLDYDLVIDATGEEALSIALNEYLMQARINGKTPDAIYARLFGNGAAAQTLLVDGLEHACFKCLKPSLHEPARFDPIRSGYEITQRVATCGEGAFVPYAVAAPVSAAALALQAVLEWNSGNIKHRLRSLQIDPENSVAVAPKNPTRSERCPCCAAYSATSRPGLHAHHA